MKTDLLASRHIGINEQDTTVMLRKIGVDSLDELIEKTIPANIRLKEPGYIDYIINARKLNPLCSVSTNANNCSV